MNQVIVNIVVAILGMAIGFTVCSKVIARGLFQKFYSGFLNVTIDPDDGQVYMSRGLYKVEANHKKHLRKKTKMAKTSKRRNRA